VLTPKTPSREAPSRVWFLGHGCRQVPPERIGGKVLWAHPDGYFLNAQGQKVKDHLSPAMKNNSYGGSPAYPTVNHQFYDKLCHHLMYEAWYGARTKGMEIDHLNGDKMDYRPSNLQEVTPAENRRRAKILRAMRAVGLDPRTYSREELLANFQKYTID